MKNIVEKIDKLIYMARMLVLEHPSDARLKAILLSLEEVKNEFSKSELDKTKIVHLAYVVTRIFTDIMDFENTPFGEDLGRFLVELNEFISSNLK